MGTTGYRRLTRESLDARKEHIENERGVSHREVKAAAREASEALDLPTSTRQLLQELARLWGEQDFGSRLLVWPSNADLMLKTGLSERAIRYGIANLVKLGLITMKDSANGKRFPIRNAHGHVIDAYGFDLTPLYARRGEFEAILARQKLVRASLRLIHEQITVCRRAITEALLALSESFPEISVADLLADLSDLMRATPRRSPHNDLESLERLKGLWMDLRIRAEERFYNAGNGGTDCRHIEPTNLILNSIDQKVIEDDHAAIAAPQIEPSLVLEACPAYAELYEKPIRTERELVAAAEYLRPCLGAHVSAWNEAVELLGPAGAAVIVFLTLQRQTDDPEAMKNPGGYFRAMARNAAERKINLGLELMERRRRRMTRGTPTS